MRTASSTEPSLAKLRPSLAVHGIVRREENAELKVLSASERAKLKAICIAVDVILPLRAGAHLNHVPLSQFAAKPGGATLQSQLWLHDGIPPPPPGAVHFRHVKCVGT